MADSDAGRNALLESLHALEVRALQVLGSREQVDEEMLAEAAEMQEAQARTALGWLLSKELVCVVSEETRREVRLTETGESYAERGTPEERIWRHLRAAGPTAMPALIAAAGIEKEEQSGAIGMLAPRRDHDRPAALSRRRTRPSREVAEGETSCAPCRSASRAARELYRGGATAPPGDGLAESAREGPGLDAA